MTMLVKRITALAAVSLSLCLLMLAGCDSAGKPSPAPQISAPQHTVATQGGNGFDAGGGDSLLGGGQPEPLTGLNNDPGNAYPLTQQSLFDFSQTGIAPWGPVTQSMQVVVAGQTHQVNRLLSNDPFTAMYQMENGDIVFSNEPLARLVGTIVEGPTPPTEAWTGPDGTHTIFSGEIMVLFRDEVTQQQIAAEIAQHNLHVLMSWFEPPETPGTGNAIASFEFRYDPLEFTTFAAAYAHFNADPLVVAAVPDALDAFTADYAQGLPNDFFYSTSHVCQQINMLQVDSSPYPRFGPPWDLFAATAVAVFDGGVARLSEDFHVLGAAPFYGKISWCGVTTYENPKATQVGSICGEATLPDPGRPGAKVSHGTSVAGTITAATNNNSMGVAGLAPQCGVVPIRLFETLDQQNREHPTPSSIVNALVAMRKTFRSTDWVQNVSVANHSYSADDTASYSFYNKWFSRDAGRCDRLHIASAGNTCDADERYPAALVPVLGVSGLLIENDTLWWPNLPGEGSTWYTDQTAPPEQRKYPVSGIFGFSQDRWNWADVAFVTASPVQDNPQSHYRSFSGTSFAAPQVAALAALLRNARPSARYYEVANRIVATRRLDIEEAMESAGVPLAGLVDFNAALTGW